MDNKKSLYNILYSILGQVATIVIGILIPRFLLLNYGSETNGFISSVTQIITYLSLLEAGVGTATVQALYKPVAEDNKKSISAILSATNLSYKKTGLVYLVLVVLLSVLYPFVIKTSLSYFTIFTIILLNGLVGVVSYFYQAKYKLLLQAEGKSYVTVNLTTVCNVSINIVRVILMNLSVNIIVVQSMYLVFNFFQMLFFNYYIKKYYSWLELNEKPDFESIAQKNAVLVYQITAMIFEHTDVLLLSILCDLKVVSLYSLYKAFYGMVETLIHNFSNGFVFRLGQAYNTQKKSFMRMYDAYETYYMGLIYAIYSTVYIWIIPFMKLYTEGISDINYIDEKLSFLFILIYLLSTGRRTSANAINYAGHFKATQLRSVAEAVINLIATLIGIYFFGIYGALFGTIVALFYRTNDMIIYSNKHILSRSPFITYKRWLINIPVFLLIIFLNEFYQFYVSSYFSLMLYAGICFLLLLLVYFVWVSIFDINTCKDVYSYIKNVIKNKLKGKRR